MFVRRHRLRIEIEQQTFRMEQSVASPLHDVPPHHTSEPAADSMTRQPDRPPMKSVDDRPTGGKR
jgi:hypothetical protein